MRAASDALSRQLGEGAEVVFTAGFSSSRDDFVYPYVLVRAIPARFAGGHNCIEDPWTKGE